MFDGLIVVVSCWDGAQRSVAVWECSVESRGWRGTGEVRWGTGAVTLGTRRRRSQASACGFGFGQSADRPVLGRASDVVLDEDVTGPDLDACTAWADALDHRDSTPDDRFGEFGHQTFR